MAVDTSSAQQSVEDGQEFSLKMLELGQMQANNKVINDFGQQTLQLQKDMSNKATQR